MAIFLSAHLSFNFYLCAGYMPCTSMFCMLLLLLSFFRFMLENVLVQTSILFTYVTVGQDISWAVRICSTSVLKNRKRPFKVASHLALKHRLIPKKRGINNTVLYGVIYSNALYKINIIYTSKKNERCP